MSVHRVQWNRASFLTYADRGRGARGRSGGGRGSLHGSRPSKKRFLLQDLETQDIKVIPKFEGEYEGDVVLSELTSIGSYNWQEASKPTIMIPGHPRLWLDRSTPFQVEPDKGFRFCDQNSSRLPVYPLLPLVAAVEQQTQDQGKAGYDWASVDFVTDRNNLRKLLRWLMGQEKSRTFRIDLQLGGTKTIIMERWEERTKDWMDGKSYGFNFEDASTSHYRGCEKSTSHHRVISYDMGGLNMVVRFEVDGCILPTSDSNNSTQGGDPLEQLTEQLSSLQVAPSTTPISGLNIVRGGADTPVSSLLEMTTRKEVKWQSCYSQLFFSQTSVHIWAKHENGMFKSIKTTLLDSPELKKANETLQPGLRKLRSFLEIVRELVLQHGEGIRLSLVYGEDKQLRLFRRADATSCLPKGYLARFDLVQSSAEALNG